MLKHSIVLALILVLFSSCDSMLSSPDEVADRFIKSIQDKDFTQAYIMLSDTRRASIDTSNFMSNFNILNDDNKNVNLMASLARCENLMKLLQDSAKFAHQKIITSQNPGAYNLVVSTYDPEEVLKATMLELQENASVVDILRYSIMSEEQQYNELEKKALEYILTHDSIPRKNINIPFTVSHNGVRYVID